MGPVNSIMGETGENPLSFLFRISQIHVIAKLLVLYCWWGQAWIAPDEPTTEIPARAKVVGDANTTDQPVDFNRDIRPLLARHCLNCHGPDEDSREADLRLDRFADATAAAQSGEFPIVPGKPDASEVLRRIMLDRDDGEQMPPTGKGLSEQEIDLIRRWIAGGAKYEAHWAFVKPVRPSLPVVRNADWVTNEIDRFVLKQLEEKSLSPSPQADRYRLVRRVYLDLIGVPPTIEQADQFVQDSSPAAYEKMVDRVLASPKFGERWARVWLDLARYADSQGYAQDSPRQIYRYRDWVVDAINRNVPFDQFTIEQLAGDMLDQPTNEQLIATAFHRNTMTNSEGGTDDEEFRTAAVVDRVNTTLQVWMGMTMGCAQCHTHKYDPISQEEYFQVFALLNQTADADRGNEAPVHPEFSQARLNQQQLLRKQIETVREKLAEEGEDQDAAGVLPEGPLQARYVRVQGLGKMFLHLAEVEVFADQKNLAVTGKAAQSSTAYSGPANLGNDGNTDGDFQKASVTHTAEELDPWWEVDLGSPQSLSRVVVWNRTDSSAVRDRLRKFRVILYDQNRRPIWTEQSGQTPNPSREFRIPATADSLTDDQKKQLLAIQKEPGSGLSETARKLQALEEQLQKVSQPDITTPVMQELPANQRRETRIQIRGNFRNPGKPVEPGTPSVFHALESTGQQPNRLDFARWLVSENNPLTARVTVNRFWEKLFGTGIVETSEDFGTQGELPSHPLLLDYLATEFVRHDWDVKWLLKEIVTSSTYRQTSRVTPELQQIDPANRWLARGPRVRLSAEMIRDQALFVADSLSTKMNGPSVRPPRPKLGLRAAFGGSTDWETSPGEDAYRRGLYTTWRRTSPYPSMTTFDAPSREFCTIRRSRTNTPLQALVTLNDPVYVDAARRLARIVSQEGENDQQRLAHLFRRVLVRPASPAELAVLQQMLDRVRKQLTVEKAQKLLADLPRQSGEENELASWVVIGNVILNLDETLARP